ncbi:MAG: ABC transporter ATP-binding protein [Alkalispirochaetaceae bacterium]
MIVPAALPQRPASAARSAELRKPIIELQRVTKRFGPTILAVDNLSLEVHRGEFLALLGPSGCGKSTTLRLLAGLEAPEAGKVLLAGRHVAGEGAWVAPEDRNIGMVFQDYALFPHLTIGANVGFPLAGTEGKARRERIEELMEMVEMGGSVGRYPHQISGGQQQRVALARALAMSPTLVLLDEPFSNLDAALRENTRREVRRILREAEATSILVTHDQEEALSLADRVAVMFDGSIAQVGSPEEIYLTPADRKVARFVGAASFIDGSADGTIATSPIGPLRLARPARGAVSILLRPEMVRVVPSPQGRARVVSRRFFGPYQIATLELSGGHALEARLPPEQRVREAERCRVEVRGPVVAFPS